MSVAIAQSLYYIEYYMSYSTTSHSYLKYTNHIKNNERLIKESIASFAPQNCNVKLLRLLETVFKHSIVLMYDVLRVKLLI